jgi:hypothetical protein
MTIAPAREIFVWFGKYLLPDGKLVDIQFDYGHSQFNENHQYDIFYIDDTGKRHELSVSGKNIIKPKYNYSLGTSY